METNILITPKMDWESFTGFPENIKAKTLRDDRHRGAKTLLVNIPPGGEIPPHSHCGVVQHYVIDGEYEMEERNYAAGAFVLFPLHCDISRITTRDGATVLMIYDPIVE